MIFPAVVFVAFLAMSAANPPVTTDNKVPRSPNAESDASPIAASDAKIVQPCQGRKDIVACVGAFLAAHSSCDVSRRRTVSLPNDVSMSSPSLNLAVNWHGISLGGIEGGQIKTFFYNKETKAAVLETYFPQVTTTGSLDLFMHKTGEEPAAFEFSNTIEYDKLTLTTTFKNYEKLNLVNTMTFADLPGEPIVVKESGFINVDPKKVTEDLKRLRDIISKNKRTTELDAIFFRAPVIAAAFINKELCSFA